LSEISGDISKTSAVASWSGFVYQGKIAIYESISLLTKSHDAVDNFLKIEHLDDFAIFLKSGKALSVHQVKANKSEYRSSYTKALSDASSVYTLECDKNTKRYFHVSVGIDDSSSYNGGGHKVDFYKYHDDELYVSPCQIDSHIKYMVGKYLDEKEKNNSSHLIEYKFDKLNSLISSRVNYIHAVNQKTKKTQYEAADTNPILFEEIVSCLDAVVIDLEDEKFLLERFRSKFISLIDEFISMSGDEMSILYLSESRSIIAGFDDSLVRKFYYSLDPKRAAVSPDVSDNDIYCYIEIINSLPRFISENSIPHYITKSSGKYIPSSLQVRKTTKEVILKKIVDNIEDIRSNASLLDVLYEFDSLILSMDDDQLDLLDTLRANGKCTHNSGIDDDIDGAGMRNVKNKVMKAKGIKFVSVDKAQGDISD